MLSLADNYNHGGNYANYDGYRQGGRNARGICQNQKKKKKNKYSQ